MSNEAVTSQHAGQDEHDDEDGYRGEASLRVGDEDFTVQVELRGHFQPIDGYYRWYGRVAKDERLSAKLGGKKAEARLSTPDGAADCQLSDPDPWDRYRVLGSSTPPFHVPKTLEEIEGELPA